jgi:alpha-L-arabinofuranosidase
LGSGGPGWLYRSPTYYSQTLYQRAAGTFPLQVGRRDDLASHLREPDLSATVSADGTKLRIYAVNSTARPRTVRMNLKNFDGSIVGSRVMRLRDARQTGDSEAMNTHDDPNRISISVRTAAPRGNSVQYSFEALSVTLIECDLRKSRQ